MFPTLSGRFLNTEPPAAAAKSFQSCPTLCDPMNRGMPGLPVHHVNVHSCHLLFDHFQFTLIHGPNIPSSCAILFLIASDFTSITSHTHNWVLFLLWLHLFIISGVISPLFSSSILGTYQPEDFIFQFPIFLPLHSVD